MANLRFQLSYQHSITHLTKLTLEMALENVRGLGRVGSLRTWLKPSSFFLSCDYGAVYNRALFFCYSRVYNNNNNNKTKTKKKTNDCAL